MTKSYFNINKFKISLGVFAACCSMAFYSCAIHAYETEEIVEEVLDTQKAASTEKLVASTEKYDESSENLYEKEKREGFDETTRNLDGKEIKEGSSEVQTTAEKGPFTIQIGAFNREYRAVNLLNSARQTLNTDVYYQFINSQFKVRLGEFPTKADALGTLEKLWGLGFYGAFIAKK